MSGLYPPPGKEGAAGQYGGGPDVAPLGAPARLARDEEGNEKAYFGDDIDGAGEEREAGRAQEVPADHEVREEQEADAPGVEGAPRGEGGREGQCGDERIACDGRAGGGREDGPPADEREEGQRNRRRRERAEIGPGLAHLAAGPEELREREARDAGEEPRRPFRGRLDDEEEVPRERGGEPRRHPEAPAREEPHCGLDYPAMLHALDFTKSSRRRQDLPSPKLVFKAPFGGMFMV